MISVVDIISTSNHTLCLNSASNFNTSKYVLTISACNYSGIGLLSMSVLLTGHNSLTQVALLSAVFLFRVFAVVSTVQ